MNNFTTQKILIISDLFGLHADNHADDAYIWQTANFFEARGYTTEARSALTLANIKPNLSQEQIHQAFLSTGINQAATELCKEQNAYDLGIGFSIGGTILWEAATQKKTLFKRIICISATRLRYKSDPAPCLTITIYGENDPFAPKAAWANSAHCQYHLLKNAAHDFYKIKETLATALTTLT